MSEQSECVGLRLDPVRWLSFYFPIVQSGSIPASMAPLGIFLLSVFLAGSPIVVECQHGWAGGNRQSQPAQTGYRGGYGASRGYQTERFHCMANNEDYDCIFRNVYTVRPHQSGATSYAFGCGNVSSHGRLAFRDSTLRFLPKTLLDSFPYVEVLNLESLQMDSIEPRAFQHGQYLRELFMSHNYLTVLDAGVFDYLSSLQLLAMDRNELAQLPAGLFNYLANLTELSMSNNKLLRIEDATFQYVTSLEYLNVSSNQIVYFNPSQIVNASDIDVSFNLLTHLNIPARLTSLYAQNNRIQMIIGQSWVLEVLQLSHNNLSGLEWLPRFPGLKQLDLSHNELEEVKASHFRALTNLEILLLNNNRMFTLDVRPDSLSKLKKLDLSHNQLVYVERNEPLFTKLQELYLHQNAIVSLKLKAGHGITNISLSRNDWDCKNLRALIPLLSATTVGAGADGHCKPLYIPENVRGVQICCKESSVPYIDRVMEQIRLIGVFEKNKRTKDRCYVDSDLLNSVKSLDSEMKQNSHILTSPSAKQLEAMKSDVAALRQEVSDKDRVLEDLREAVNQNLRRFNVPILWFDPLETLIEKLLRKLSDRNRFWVSQATGAWADTVAKKTEMEELSQLINAKTVENVNKRGQLEKLKKNIQDKKKECQQLEINILRKAHA